MFTAPPLVIAVVLFLVRGLLAFTFFHESLLKLKDVRRFAKNDGLPLPLAWFVPIAEFAAALSFATGVLAQFAGIGVVVLMLITISMQNFRWHSKYWAADNGWEYDLFLLTLAAVIAVFGAGPIAIPTLFGMA
ncbi:DoxX family membrane protein [Brevibacterium sp. XM4083]|uniref:DoxX family protein n=1 Tax=Brevibacterium sp. XM4083 TaxID=2583238 RepID=UPI00112C91C8|nr:DoxX family membrane protein [Brevibacterium sp. XM4083]